MPKYIIHYPSGRELDNAKNIMGTDITVMVREEGKIGTYALCTLEAAEKITRALNYEAPKLVVNQ